jgi:hypothetical protein
VKGGAYKNWRLNGEYISDPPNDPNRFKVLQPGDLVVFDFIGSVIPDSAKMLLIARHNENDQLIHQRLSLVIGTRKMSVLSLAQLQAIAVEIRDAEHPIHEFTLDEELEDAAKGGAKGRAILGRKPLSRKVGRDELQRARQAGEQVGRAGEEFVLAYLTSLKANGSVEDITWVADINAVAPYDFLVTLIGGDEIALDVKSTAGEFDRPIHVSANELAEMTNATRRYDLYRVFEITENTARLRVAQSVSSFAGTVLESLAALPEGIQIDSISVELATLQFGNSIDLTMPEDAEGELEG